MVSQKKIVKDKREIESLKSRFPFLNWVLDKLSSLGFKVRYVVVSSSSLAIRAVKKHVGYPRPFDKEDMTISFKNFEDVSKTKVRVRVRGWGNSFDSEYVEDISCLDNYAINELYRTFVKDKTGKDVDELSEEEDIKLSQEFNEWIEKEVQKEVDEFYRLHDGKKTKFTLGRYIRGYVYRYVVESGYECIRYYYVEDLVVYMDLTRLSVFLDLYDYLPLLI